MPNFQDLAGQRFYHLLVLETFQEQRKTYKATICRCLCDCGAEKLIAAQKLKSGNTQSCRCLHNVLQNQKYKDITGQRFGRLVAVEYAGTRRLGGKGQSKVQWRCQCDCGNEIIAIYGSLASGDTKSCKCLSAESVRKAIAKNTIHGKSWHPLYNVWQHMMRRCYDIKNSAYKDYGKRGIYVEESWHTFQNFYDDLIGEYIKGLMLERVNNDGPYAKSNCIFASMLTQVRNRRTTIFLECGDIRQTLMEWSEEVGIKYATLLMRHRKGWSVERILFEPLRVWPGKSAKRVSKRHSFLSSVPVNDFDDTQWQAMQEEFDYRCAYCKERKPLSQDHVMPLSKGGSHTKSNIVPACEMCNARKGTKTLSEFFVLP